LPACKSKALCGRKQVSRFVNRVAIVTGGARGIGAATALRLAEEGAKVLVADLVEPEERHDNIAFRRTDVTSAADCKALVADAIARWGRLDIVVNNAGTGALAATPEMDEELWDKVFAINAKAVFLCCKAAIPAMRAGGAIVNIASISGLFGDYAMDAYNASKGAVVNYTRNLALNCASGGIRVNAVCPGLVETVMAAQAIADPVDRAFWFNRIPLHRAAQPSEIAAVVAFLASDDASYLTGSIVTADGGITAHTGQPNAPERIRERHLRSGG